MKEASQVVGLPLMGIKEGTTQGNAKDFVIDPKTKCIKSIILKLDKNYDYRELFTSDVVGVGKDFIIAQSLEKAKQMDLMGVQMTLLGMKCISSTGDLLGSIVNFAYEEKTGVIKAILLDNGKEVEGSNIVSLSNSLMFVDFENNTKQSKASAFEREQRDYVVGRKLTADLVDAEGEVIAKKDTVVTEEIMHAADKAGLTADLMLNLE